MYSRLIRFCRKILTLPPFGCGFIWSSFVLKWAFVPCDELGGDIFNIFKIDDDHICIYMIDVSGHGVKAALLSVTISWILTPSVSVPDLEKNCTISTAGYDLSSPIDVANRLNEQFAFNTITQQFFTMFFGLERTVKKLTKNSS